VIFNFSEVVPENERDPMLAEKIEGELAVIIRHLLVAFPARTKPNSFCMSSRNQKKRWPSNVKVIHWWTFAAT
jgi:phage/plasmid-associated DNA primase